MALTKEQENALVDLLAEPAVTLNELPKATVITDDDLFLTRQNTDEKAVTGKVLKEYVSPAASLTTTGIVRLTSSITSTSETTAATAKAAKTAYDLANGRLAKASNLSDLTDKAAARINLGLEEMLYPVGAPIPWPTAQVPTGYLKCDGNSFDKVKYPKLALAYPSGKLPDLRGEFIRGWDDGRGVDAGRGILSFQDWANGKHSHGISFNGVMNYDAASGSTLSKRVTNNEYSFTTEEVGDIESRPRNIAFLYIVRAA